MQSNTFVSVRLENIEKRFSEVDTLLLLAKSNKHEVHIYSALCRSAHVLLVSHVEGIYKDIVKDILDDLNHNTNFLNLPSSIFRTFSLHFIHTEENKANNEKIKDKLWEAFKEYKTNLKHEPFLRVDNKNPTPKILEEILTKFGEKNFFESLSQSKLEIVFENSRKTSLKELERIKKYTKAGTMNFPYTVDKSYYATSNKNKQKRGLFEEFLDDFLRDRHSIVHGHRLDSPKNSVEIESSKLKIEMLIYAFILCLCSNCTPIYFLENNQE